MQVRSVLIAIAVFGGCGQRVSTQPGAMHTPDPNDVHPTPSDPTGAHDAAPREPQTERNSTAGVPLYAGETLIREAGVDRYHRVSPIGDYRIVARGAVESKLGNTTLHAYRARLEAPSAELAVDVIVHGAPGVIAHDTQRTFLAFGKAEVIAGRTVQIARSDGEVEVRWLSRPGAGWMTYALRVRGRVLKGSERDVVGAYLTTFPPPPWPLRFAPMQGYTPDPPPGPCPADKSHCCIEDGRIVMPGGCQPDYPDNTAPNAVRGRDGFCEPTKEGCFSRCLPADASIATPAGAVPISQLRVGDRVWSRAANGERIAAPIRTVISIPVTGHHLVELVLADGRVVRGSPRHPLTAHGTLGELAVGDVLDGSRVTRVGVLPYTGATWDLRPATPSGIYWANGVAIGSTLNE